MAFRVCPGCGQVTPQGPAPCPRCGPQGSTGQFHRTVALLGLTLVAGCPKSSVNSKYGVEANDTAELADEPSDEPQNS
jgi:hypothetical protein